MAISATYRCSRIVPRRSSSKGDVAVSACLESTARDRCRCAPLDPAGPGGIGPPRLANMAGTPAPVLPDAPDRANAVSPADLLPFLVGAAGVGDPDLVDPAAL